MSSSKARQKRLDQAREWFPKQNFTEESHIVSAYRHQFKVDKNCAMKELCLLGMLSPEKQKTYEEQIRRKKERRLEKRFRREEPVIEQDEVFAFIAGYTPGGIPYGITWEEQTELDRKEKERTAFQEEAEDDFELPF